MESEFGTRSVGNFANGIFYLKTNDSETAASLALDCLKKHQFSRFDIISLSISNRRMSKSEWYGKSADELGLKEISIFLKSGSFFSEDFHIIYNYGQIPDKLE